MGTFMISQATGSLDSPMPPAQGGHSQVARAQLSGPPAHSWLAFLIIFFGQDYANKVIAKYRYYPSWLDILG